MRNQTYRNVMILIKRLQKKGYNLEESKELAFKCFENSAGNNNGMRPEQFEQMILSKEDWETQNK